jgi:hypothetical protein
MEFQSLLRINGGRLMRTAEGIRQWIVATFFNNPILGKHYIDWHTEDGECGVTIIFPNTNEQFDIIIKKK